MEVDSISQKFWIPKEWDQLNFVVTKRDSSHLRYYCGRKLMPSYLESLREQWWFWTFKLVYTIGTRNEKQKMITLSNGS